MNAVFESTITDVHFDELLADKTDPKYSTIEALVKTARNERSRILVRLARERLAEIYNLRLLEREQDKQQPLILLGADQSTVRIKGGS